MMSIYPIVRIQLLFLQFSLCYVMIMLCYVMLCYNYVMLCYNYVMSFVFYQKQNVRPFIIILGVTMKAVAFES